MNLHSFLSTFECVLSFGNKQLWFAFILFIFRWLKGHKSISIQSSRHWSRANFRVLKFWFGMLHFEYIPHFLIMDLFHHFRRDYIVIILLIKIESCRLGIKSFLMNFDWMIFLLIFIGMYLFNITDRVVTFFSTIIMIYNREITRRWLKINLWQ